MNKLRTTNKTSGGQIKITFQRKNCIHVVDKEDLRILRENATKDQIQRRIKLTDKHFHDCADKLDDIPLAGSDWRN